jgi:organic radical activating enzyme
MRWDEITDELIKMDVGLVIISGGEPLLHQKQGGWELVLRTLSGAGIRVEIETNGTVEPRPVTVQYAKITCSPKLDHAGMPEDRRIIPGVLYTLIMAGADFKFVCATPDHVAEVQRIVKQTGIPASRVWIMPEGITTSALCDHLAVITDPAVAAGFNVTTRLHIHVWGDARGH